MENKLLSIFIPTYKRELLLQECISSFIKEARELNIHIYISSNGQSSIAEKLKSFNTHLNIHFFEHPQNVGPDKNFATVLNLNIKSKYVLMLADDDLIKEGGLRELYTDINNFTNDFQCILLNGIFFNNKTSFIKRLFETEEDTIIDDPSEFLKKTWDRMHYSSVIINLESASSFTYKKFYNTLHLYSAMATMPMTTNNAKCLIRGKDTILFRVGPKTWSDTTFKIHFDSIPSYYQALPSVYKSIVEEHIIPLYTKTLAPYKNLLQMIPANINLNESLIHPLLRTSHKLVQRVRLISSIPRPIRLIIKKGITFLKKIQRP